MEWSGVKKCKGEQGEGKKITVGKMKKCTRFRLRRTLKKRSEQNMASSLLAAIDTSLKHLSFYLANIYSCWPFTSTGNWFCCYCCCCCWPSTERVGLRRFGTCVRRMCANIIQSYTQIYLYFFPSFFRSPLCNGNNPHEKLPAKNIYRVQHKRQSATK